MPRLKSLKAFSLRHPFARLLEKAHARGIAYTSLDLMKLFAVLSMTVDHIGFYFFPHEMWWRALGRTFVPIWFFLAGYTRARSFAAIFWVYGALLVVDRLFVGRPLFPLNVLVSILLCRMVLNVCEKYHLLPARLPEVMAASILGSFFTVWFFEYGSIAFLFALLGRMVYVGETRLRVQLMIISGVTYIAWQLVSFSDFNALQRAYVILSCAWVVYWLGNCANKIIWPDWTQSRWKTAITLLSRNTLPYYFWHRMLLEILSAIFIGGGLGLSLHFFTK